MDMDTALDRHTRCGTVEAMTEIENHGHQCYISDNTLYASVKPGKFEQVCIIFKGEVKTRTLMLWLGY